MLTHVQSGPPCSVHVAKQLNAECRCRTLQHDRLTEVIDAATGVPGLSQRLAETHPHLYAPTTVFISSDEAQRIARAVDTLERVTALPGYRKTAIARAPAMAAVDHGPHGVVMGYDFHLADDGPRLIEINTNAGGLFLNQVAVSAHLPGCGYPPASHRYTMAAWERSVVSMFESEWRSQRGDAPLRTIAIVDDEPEGQFLWPEFLMFERLFARFGFDAMVVDARSLEWSGGKLSANGRSIDLCYNRSTDFYLDQPEHAALKAALETGAAVVTPHPRAHALYADKRNLVALADPEQWERWGVSTDDRSLLASVVPSACEVTPERADGLWQDRKHWFFKPYHGFGSKAAYRGDKLTRRVWAEVRAGGFIAQRCVPPSERASDVEPRDRSLKFDVRAYTDNGQILLLAARLYLGQTTNFRTPGGGFAPIAVLESH